MAITGFTPQRPPVQRLDFGDRDLTDTFADVQDDSLSSGAGHPRGSSPISGITSSRRSTPSNAFSAAASSAFGASPSKQPLPNFSALLAFLDGDTEPNPPAPRRRVPHDANDDEATPLRPSSTKDPDAHPRVHLSPTPSILRSASANRSAALRSASENGSPLTPSTSSRRQNGPSAADRMAAALMEGAPPARWDNEGIRAPPATAPAAPEGRFFDWREGGGEAGLLRPPHQSYDPRARGREIPAGGFGLSRTSDLPQSLLDEVQQEFHDIVSRSSHRSSHPRNGDASVEPGDESGVAPSNLSVSAREGASFSSPNRRPQGEDEEDAADGEDKRRLTEALSQARSDAVHLQSQVDSLKSLVQRLAGTPASAREASPDVAASTRLPSQPKSGIRQIAPIAAEDDDPTARRKLTPRSRRRQDPPLDPDPDPSRRFVRIVDALVWTPSASGGGRRRDEDIFEEENLRLLGDRVRVWAALSRWTPGRVGRGDDRARG